MPIIPTFRRLQAVRYTVPTDSTDMLSLYQAKLANDGLGQIASIISATGTACVIQTYYPAEEAYRQDTWLVGEWLVVDMSMGQSRTLTHAQYLNTYLDSEAAAALLVGTQAFATTVAGQASGFGSLPNITVPGLGNANFEVPIRPRQPNANFTAVPFLTGSTSLLGALAITGLSAGGTVQAANKLTATFNGATVYDRVRVNVANSGALQLAGAAILAHVSPG